MKARRRIQESRNEPEANSELITAPGMEAGYDAVGVTSLLLHSTALQSKEDPRVASVALACWVPSRWLGGRVSLNPSAR